MKYLLFVFISIQPSWKIFMNTSSIYTVKKKPFLTRLLFFRCDRFTFELLFGSPHFSNFYLFILFWCLKSWFVFDRIYICEVWNNFNLIHSTYNCMSRPLVVRNSVWDKRGGKMHAGRLAEREGKISSLFECPTSLARERVFWCLFCLIQKLETIRSLHYVSVKTKHAISALLVRMNRSQNWFKVLVWVLKIVFLIFENIWV